MIEEALDKKYRNRALKQLSIEYGISLESVIEIGNSIIQPFNIYNYPDFNIFIAFLESTIKCHSSYGLGYC